jgi:RNA polymerase sigma factor (sigma-70 family)
MLATKTTTRLLDALRDPSNEPAWGHIDARFRPVIAGLARRMGLGESDAEEVAQQTLSEFVRAYREGRYDRSKGRLSSWILGIARHTSLRMMRDAGRTTRADSGVLAEAPDDDALRDVWTEERDRSIAAAALSALHDESGLDERTLLAFELFALRGVPAPEVASQCSMSVDQVYVAKNRVTTRLRRIIKQMTDAFEEDA